MADVYEFYNLGIGDPMPYLCMQTGWGIGDMLDEVVSVISKKDGREEDDDDRPRIAIVGNPNVGKSSIINRLDRREPGDRIRHCRYNTGCH